MSTGRWILAGTVAVLLVTCLILTVGAKGGLWLTATSMVALILMIAQKARPRQRGPDSQDSL